MHRHGYKGRKFHRERDQRTALVKGLAEALIINETIETTLPKAKTTVPYVEKLITKAKKNDLHNRRQIIKRLQTVSSAHKLIDEIAPKLGKRQSGHLRIERTRLRRGDNAQLARVEFVDDLQSAPVSTPAEKKADETITKPSALKKPAKSTKKVAKVAAKDAKS